ncbi:hypothetical protein PAPYR_2298 [Paratrimastix pyriformis]|uniref:Uncharacterized protein n=1 Tax=Paratrimastix pyriformis TaxID=342808 RepID=A0ABQ8UQ18_9EUKA|nr:hypothetical protein PAPYR_2298 [Paratrimastix pyriformis]
MPRGKRTRSTAKKTDLPVTCTPQTKRRTSKTEGKEDAPSTWQEYIGYLHDLLLPFPKRFPSAPIIPDFHENENATASPRSFDTRTSAISFALAMLSRLDFILDKISAGLVEYSFPAPTDEFLEFLAQLRTTFVDALPSITIPGSPIPPTLITTTQSGASDVDVISLQFARKAILGRIDALASFHPYPHLELSPGPSPASASISSLSPSPGHGTPPGMASRQAPDPLTTPPPQPSIACSFTLPTPPPLAAHPTDSDKPLPQVAESSQPRAPSPPHQQPTTTSPTAAPAPAQTAPPPPSPNAAPEASIALPAPSKPPGDQPAGLAPADSVSALPSPSTSGTAATAPSHLDSKAQVTPARAPPPRCCVQ